MKKILIILTFLLIPFIASAEGSAGGICPIEKTPNKLSEYIEAYKRDLQLLVVDIKKDKIKELKANAEKKKEKWFVDDIKGQFKEIGRVTWLKLKRLGTTVADWSNFETDFDFWIWTWIDFTPSQVYRDHDLIDAISEHTKGLIITMEEEDFDTKKKFLVNGKKVSLSDLYDRNQQLLSYFKETVAEKTVFADGQATSIFTYDSPYTKKQITIDLKIYQDAFSSCQERDYVAEINRIFEDGFKDIWKDWEQGYKLMLGLTGDFEDWVSEEEYRKVEKQLLKEELSRQGISDSQAALILENLDNANTVGKNWEVSWSHASRLNIISQWTKDELALLKSSLWNLKEDFKEFADKLDHSVDIENLSEKSLNELIDYKTNLNKLSSEIAELYEAQKVATWKWNTSSKELVGNIRAIHREIISAVKNLKETQKLTQEVCESQWANLPGKKCR